MPIGALTVVGVPSFIDIGYAVGFFFQILKASEVVSSEESVSFSHPYGPIREWCVL